MVYNLPLPKWNALGFRPGLVGGHCIGVDPYYFTYEAEKLGYHSQIILNGRIVNDSMGAFVADVAVKKMIEAGQAPKKSKVAVMGLTFKEDCPDVRNSKVVDIINRLDEYGINTIITDPWASADEAKKEYGLELKPFNEIDEADCLIVAVAHREYREMKAEDLKKIFRDSNSEGKVLLDVKGIYEKDVLEDIGINCWRL